MLSSHENHMKRTLLADTRNAPLELLPSSNPLQNFGLREQSSVFVALVKNNNTKQRCVYAFVNGGSVLVGRIQEPSPRTGLYSRKAHRPLVECFYARRLCLQLSDSHQRVTDGLRASHIGASVSCCGDVHVCLDLEKNDTSGGDPWFK